MLIQSRQQTTRLRKITVISVITSQAHFSQGIAKLDTLPNLLLTFANTYIHLHACVHTCVCVAMYVRICVCVQFTKIIINKVGVFHSSLNTFVM